MAYDHDKVESILVAALEIPSAIDRQEYVRQACADDPALQAQVEKLIENHLQAGSFLNLHDEPNPNSDCMSDFENSSIGPYKLLQKLGEGGMGVVFLAEQSEPFRRQVALKVIRVGMNSAQVVARFEQERQALAVMDHINIARVIDGGSTTDGRPYFAMELIQGPPQQGLLRPTPIDDPATLGTFRASLPSCSACPPERHYPSRPQTNQCLDHRS